MNEFDAALGKLTIASLKGQLESTRLHAESLAGLFRDAKTELETGEIAREYEAVLKQRDMLQMLLDTMDSQIHPK